MNNQLANENSPYLLQHAQNPVNWSPWGEEALLLAKNQDKPIFLSIGYAACHWCHVMAHESFEDPEIAAILNDYFVNIKVDREERPDIDSIYMNAVIAITGQGGWPLSVFLTPDGKPFFGGTYFPPTPRYKMPGFKNILLSVTDAWNSAKGQINQNAVELTRHLQNLGRFEANNDDLKPSYLDSAVVKLFQSYDFDNGGWGKAPKFPLPMVIEFLIRRASKGDNRSLEMVTHALDKMAKGGMYDVVGGGFSRYSTDDQWLVPHFEKMLYDNALLARAYLHAYLITGHDKYKQTTEQTLNFIARELTDPSGGFYSSLDADSDGEEGKYYIWSRTQIFEALPPKDAEFVIAAYGIIDYGNFEGLNILRKSTDDIELAKLFNMDVDDVSPHLSELTLMLREVRDRRHKPAVDDKCLVMWNALACVTFSEAGRYLGNANYVQMATRNLHFILNKLLQENKLYRSWRKGCFQVDAFLEDYAALINALITHYQTDNNPYWFENARRLTEIALQNFRDNNPGTFYDTQSENSNLIIRPRDVQDNATPSGGSLMATALLQMASYSDNSEWRDIAGVMFRQVLGDVTKYPLAFGYWLCAIDRYLSQSIELAIIGNTEHPLTLEFIQAIWSKYRPDLVVSISELPDMPGSPALLDHRSCINDLPTAYVCRNFICNLPTNSTKVLLNQLDGNYQ